MQCVEAPGPGKEVECSLLGNEDPVASPPGEIVTKGHDWYDYEAKYAEGGMELLVPAGISDRATETPRDLARRVSSTELGHYLDTAHAYLAATRPSEYFGGSASGSGERAATKALPRGSRYLFVYPFWKKREWYSIPFEKRQEMMRDPFRVGHKYPNVKIHTAYSFGLDDQEFMLSFEADEPLDFLDLVMDLRPSEASKYTEWETPIFTCLLSTPEQMLDALGI